MSIWRNNAPIYTVLYVVLYKSDRNSFLYFVFSHLSTVIFQDIIIGKQMLIMFIYGGAFKNKQKGLFNYGC